MADPCPLYVTDRGQSHGDETPIIFLHGWGLNQAIWTPLWEYLPPSRRCHFVDLPGHGHSANIQDYSLANVAAMLAKRFERPCTIVAWSLSALFAMQWLLDLRSQNAYRLVLVAGTPQFFQSPDWPHAIATDHLRRFAEDLSNNYEQTLSRFLNLQSVGAPHMRSIIRLCRDAVIQAGKPTGTGLQGALTVLQSTSLVDQLNRLTLPVLIIGGKHDVLVPAAAIPVIATRLPQADYVMMEQASHAPFLSHPERFAQTLQAWW